VRGALNLVRDIARAQRVPQMVDRSGFTIGENLAATPAVSAATATSGPAWRRRFDSAD
jgi:poly(3-hydroxyalkanoate) synthetase